jgi:16S rRNA processing protein RimM
MIALNKLGTISKLHGFKGEAVVNTDRPLNKSIEKTEWVHLMIDGLPVPFFVLNITLRNENSVIVKFEDVDTSAKMEPFIGTEVFTEEKNAPRRRKVKDEMPNIQGYIVTDTHYGPIGIAHELIDYSGNLLLQVFKNETEILIPVSDETITDINPKKQQITITTPEGLLELYL